MGNVIQLCLATNNILLMRKWNYAFLLLAIALVWKWQIASLPEDIPYKKQTRWSNDNTIIELCYRKISWFVNVMYCVSSCDVCKSITYYGIKMLSWAHGRLRVSCLFVRWMAPATPTLRSVSRISNICLISSPQTNHDILLNLVQ